MNPIITEITSAQVKKDITPFKVGDGVRVHTKVREGDKERVQIYAGIVIARKGHGIHESFTVRRIIRSTRRTSKRSKSIASPRT
jgi:large subunit ribosomal protein L19